MSITITDTREAVYGCLPTAAEGWATAKAVAEVTGMTPSTVARRLRALEDGGRVESSTDKAVTGARGKVWRQRAAQLRVVGPVELPAAADEPDPVLPAPYPEDEPGEMPLDPDDPGAYPGPDEDEGRDRAAEEDLALAYAILSTEEGEPDPDSRDCAQCGTAIPRDETIAGYTWCGDCDPDGDHTVGTVETAGDVKPVMQVTPCQHGDYACPLCDVPAAVVRAAQDHDAETPDPPPVDDYVDLPWIDDEDGDPSPISPAPTGSDVAAIVEALAPADDPLTAGDARALTDRIRLHVSELLPLIKQAYSRRADLALGYASWAAYCDAELRGLRMPLAERQAATVELRVEGLSTRAIAAALGTSDATARRDLAATTAAEGAPERVTGLDGRSHPASRPKTAAGVSTSPVDGAEDFQTRSDDAPAGGGGFRHAATPGNPPTAAAQATRATPAAAGTAAADGAEGTTPPVEAPAGDGGSPSGAVPGNPPQTAAGVAQPPADGAEGVERAPDDAPAAGGGGAVTVSPTTPGGNPPVWIATRRKGIDYHRPTDEPFLSSHLATGCGRSMRTGVRLSRHAAESLYDATPCPRCWPEVPDQAVEDAALDTAERERGAHTRKPTPAPAQPVMDSPAGPTAPPHDPRAGAVDGDSRPQDRPGAATTEPGEPLAPDADAPTGVAPAPALTGEVLPAPASSDPAYVAAVADAVRTLTAAVSRLEDVLIRGPGGPLTLPDLKHERKRLDQLIRRLAEAA